MNASAGDNPPSRPTGLTRRAFLVLGGAAVALSYPVAFRTTEGYVRSLLEAEFGRDIVAGVAADNFIRDVSRTLVNAGGLRRTIARWGAIHFREAPFFTNQHADLRNIVVTLFLKRTNAYRCYVGADKVLAYTSLNPYEVGCANFLSAQFKPW
jgi:hypothetical protein